MLGGAPRKKTILRSMNMTMTEIVPQINALGNALSASSISPATYEELGITDTAIIRIALDYGHHFIDASIKLLHCPSPDSIAAIMNTMIRPIL